MGEAFANRPTTVADYLAILRRRKWIVLLPPLVGAFAAFVLSSRQQPMYRATAQVYVKRSSVVAAVLPVSDPSLGDPTRYLATLANLASSPELASRVAGAAGIPGMTPGRVLGESKVSPAPDADLLYVSVQDRDPGIARRLANTYATEFTKYTKETATATIDEALRSLQARIKSLATHGQANSALYAQLLQQQSQLDTVGKLLAGNTSVLRPADGAGKTRPKPQRDGLLGGLFGLVLGVALAFLAEALDRRIRSEEEIEEALALPLLARIPTPARSLRKADKLVMLAEPASVHAETFRKLRTSVEFLNADRAARTIMVTSAVEREGKSTTIANLAVALARSGRRVVLVDLDLRRPLLNRFFRVSAGPGITDVAIGRAKAADAIRPIALTTVADSHRSISVNGRPAAAAAAFNGEQSVEGVLHFLPAGTIPPSAGEFLADDRISAALDELVGQFELVLIDAPPLLAFGDAMTLSAKVDALLVVTRLAKVDRSLLHELGRQLHNSRAAPLGYVVTGVEHSDSYRYMYDAYAYEVRPPIRDKQRA